MTHLTRTAIVLITAILIAGCPSKPVQDDEAAAREAEREAAAAAAEAEAREAELRRIEEEERLRADPLEDPSSVLAQRTIYFDFDRSEVKPEFMAIVQAHAEYLGENSDARVTLEGHTDERGSREYNVGLGNRRAQAVRRMLMFHGANDRQIDTVSYGEEKPVASGQNEEAWSRNRRVEIVYDAR